MIVLCCKEDQNEVPFIYLMTLDFTIVPIAVYSDIKMWSTPEKVITCDFVAASVWHDGNSCW